MSELPPEVVAKVESLVDQAEGTLADVRTELHYSTEMGLASAEEARKLTTDLVRVLSDA